MIVLGEQGNLIIKHNSLIEAKYKLSLIQQKLILYAISKLRSDEEQLDIEAIRNGSLDIKDAINIIKNFEDPINVVTIHLREFSEMTHTSLTRYSELIEIAQSLEHAKIKVKDGKQHISSSWVVATRYESGSGKIDLEFSIFLLKYLLQLKDNYTQYYLNNVIRLKYKYSIRLYELLKQFQHTASIDRFKHKKRDFEISVLRDCLGCDDKKSYKQYKHFNAHVIKKAVEEINEYTDLQVRYEPIKKGREIIGISFKFRCSNPEQEALSGNEKLCKELADEVREKIINLDKLYIFTDKQIMELKMIAIEKVENTGCNVFKYMERNAYYTYKRKENFNNKNACFKYYKMSLIDDYARCIKDYSKAM